jgi:excisionase family DNA binding protein
VLVNIPQAAKELGVSVEHIRRQIRSGRWPFYKLGAKATRIDVDEIKALGRLIAEGKPSASEAQEDD